jgi:RNA polymerase sigma-70 factor, ECF subfamily
MKEFEDFSELYSTHSSRVRAVLFRLGVGEMIDDLCQDVFIKIWRAKEKFSQQSSLSTWIYRITTNTAIDYIRKRSRESLLAQENNEIKNSTNPSHEAQTIASITINKALDSLNLEQRSLVVLYYYEELDLKEIAAVLQIPEGTVKSRLFQLRKQLNEFLFSQGESHDKNI